MSSIKFESNASGTGIFTLASPATNTNRTLTLPDATGTIITTAGGAAISGTTGAFTTTVGVGGATPAASGAGITFPATASASSDANTLDDYEEGTWTPTLTSFGGTNLVATGYYTKIGRIVNWSVDITGTNVTSTANTSNFTMPFAAPSIQLMGTCVAANSSTVSYGVGVGGGTTTMQPPTWSAAARIIVTGIMTT